MRTWTGATTGSSMRSCGTANLTVRLAGSDRMSGEAGYEVGSGVTVRALHQMPIEGPEGELHAHDYRIEAVVGRRELDEHGMVCDLDLLRAALREAAAHIEGKDLERIRPPS